MDGLVETAILLKFAIEIVTRFIQVSLWI